MSSSKLPTGAAVLFFASLAFGGFVLGGELERVTHDGLKKISPSYVDGGASIVYCVHDIPYRVTFVRRNLADDKVERLLPTVETHQFGGTLSKDGGYLAYARSSSSPQLQLVIIDLKEKTEAVFSPLGGRATLRNPAFSANGRRVAFSDSGGTYGQQIATVDLKAQDIKRLTNSAGINPAPKYSPDGKRIVFASSRDGNLEVYVMDTDGANQVRLTESEGLDTHPVWSPNGKQIAFTSNRDGNYEIYVMSADGSGARNVTKNPERDDFATWHPDGKRLLFVSERAGRFDLYLVTLGAGSVAAAK